MLTIVDGVTSRAWRDGVLVASDFPLADLDQWVADAAVVVWLDLVAPDEEVLSRLADELGLDPLAVEDAVSPRERPKATRHPHHLFFTCYAVALAERVAPDPVAIDLSRISGFVLSNALVTLRRRDDGQFTAIEERWQESGLLPSGVGALVHGLLDTVVDGHFQTIQDLDEVIDGLEDQLFTATTPPRVMQQQVFAVRKALVQLRRVVLPAREVVSALMRFTTGGRPLVGPELTGHYEDLYDHVIRAGEWTESLRDLVASIFETNLSLQDARLNEVMKKLASWAAIISVPTAVTGWFGQNLPYPGFAEPFGLLQSGLLILAGTLGLYLLFRRIDWL